MKVQFTGCPRSTSYHFAMPDETKVEWGPCCFCGLPIDTTKINPCRVTVETAEGRFQVWWCHAACFKELLSDRPELMGMMEPAVF